MLLTAIGEVGLHSRVERVDVAVGMLTGENVSVFGQCVKVRVVLQEALCELSISCTCTALVGEVEVFRQSIAFIPGEGDVLVGAGCHLIAVESLGRKVGQDGIGGTVEDSE